MATILAIEDEADLRFALARGLRKAGHAVTEAGSIQEARSALSALAFDVVVTDVNLGSGAEAGDGVALVGELREGGFSGGVVVMTGFGTVEGAVRAMKLGADDYLQKPVRLDELTLVVDRIVERRRADRKLRALERSEAGLAEGPGVLGRSAAWTRAVELARRLSAVPVQNRIADRGETAGSALPTVLITGETGTGKGLIARAMHGWSAERGGAFVPVNCTSLPATLVESELFGHERGAFTDARQAREGLFEMADGGTIFLDEIGEIPVETQAKLLTVLETGSFRRVGGTQQRTVRARVIAATNQDLPTLVSAGRFRRDLLYRLNAFEIRLPALRERDDDAVELAGAFLARFRREYGRGPAVLSGQAAAAIRGHAWPGNVRELVNCVQRAAMLGGDGPVGAADLGLAVDGVGSGTTEISGAGGALTAEQAHARRAVRVAVPAGPASAAPDANGAVWPAGNAGASGGHERGGGLRFDFVHGVHLADDVERELIVQALAHTRGNVSRAARLIGMQRSSFRYRIERYGLEARVAELGARGSAGGPGARL